LPSAPTARVNDYAGVLSAADRARLESKLAERERSTGAQMFIALFSSLEGDSVEDVAVRLEERWKVGRKGVDNGVLLVVVLKERKLRIEVGYGLEPVITDAVAAAIIRDAIAPRFREQRYAAGLEAAVDQVFARIRGEPAPRSAARRSQPGLTPAAIGLMGLIFGVFVVAVAVAIRNAQHRAYTAGSSGWSSHPPIFWGGGGGGGSWSGGGGDGGFSGGGGGSSGGGGASGEW